MPQRKIADEDQLLRSAEALQARIAAGASAATLAQARKLLKELRGIRAFAALTQLAEAVCRADAADAQSRCLYAQALIDTGSCAAALGLLGVLTRDLPKADASWAEAWGLTGRAHKQVFFDAVRDGAGTSAAARQALAHATQAYAKPYKADPGANAWQGLNVLALATRARREGWKDIAQGIDTAKLAHRLAEQLSGLPAAQRDEWYLPTLAEVELGRTLAGGPLRPLQDVLAAYLKKGKPSAFQVASTLRQFTEAWALDTIGVGTPGVVLRSAEDARWLRGLPDILRALLLKLPGGMLLLGPNQVSAVIGPAARGRGAAGEAASTKSALSVISEPSTGQLEAVLGADGPQTFQWWRAGIEAARAVAVVRSRMGKRLGSGFLVRAVDLGIAEPAAGEALLLTNFHVCNPQGETPGIRPEDAEVVFEADETGKPRKVLGLVWCSPVARHDAALLRITGAPTGVQPLPLSIDLPAVPPPEEKKRPRVYVVGYPGGRELSFSFQDNELLDHEGAPAGKPQIDGVCRVHYRAPTEGGSSGSPVFEGEMWKVVALHHRGGKFGMPRLNGVAGTYAANEGLGMAALLAALRAEIAHPG
jgi:hypothetical protein